MYCSINESESKESRRSSRCCRRYNIALAFLAAILIFLTGLIIGVFLAIFLYAALPLLITAAIIIFIIFIVTLLTRTCYRRCDDD